VDYLEMAAQIRTELLHEAERRIMEAAFASEEECACGYPLHFPDADCKGEQINAYAMAATVFSADDGIIRVSVTRGQLTLLSAVSDETLRAINRLKWFPIKPLPPLVVLAKCAEGNLSCDRASKKKELEDIL